MEELQVDLGTDERTCTDRAVQWEQRSREFETMSRGTFLDVVNDAIFTERSPPAIRTHLSVNAQNLKGYGTVRADRVDLPAVGWKWGPEQTGRTPVEATTRARARVARTRRKETAKGKDTEKEKGVRVEGYCRHCGNGSIDKRIVCWS